jgi:hypothetical protein
LGIREVLILPIDWILTVRLKIFLSRLNLNDKNLIFFKQESVNNVVATMMYVAAFIIQLSTWVGINNIRAGSNIIGAFFGLLNAIAYAATSYYLYLQYKYNN